jgi:hypothetical protein
MSTYNHNGWVQDSTLSGTSTTSITGYSGTISGNSGLWTNPNSTDITTTSSDFPVLTFRNNNNNMSKQVKVAVFTVERNDKNEVKSSKFVKEFWVEQKNGGSVILAAAKQLDKDYDPDTTVVREILSITF